MNRRFWAPIALAIVGVLLILGGIATATVWKPSGLVKATSGSTTAPVIFSRSGVLDLAAKDVTITATSPDSGPVVVAVGRANDVAAWVASANRTEIEGLRTWSTLLTEDKKAEGDKPAELSDPRGSDMWVHVADGKGSTTLEWTGREGDWAFVAVTDGKKAAPQVTLEWKTAVSTPWLWPLIVGGVLMVAGAGALYYFFSKRPVSEETDDVTSATEDKPDETVEKVSLWAAVKTKLTSRGPDPQEGEDQTGSQKDEVETGKESLGEASESNSGSKVDADLEDPQKSKTETQVASEKVEPELAQNEEEKEGVTEKTKAGSTSSNLESDKDKPVAESTALTSPDISVPTSPNSSARSGRRMPSRRELREARERGENTIVVGGKPYNTGLIPVVEKQKDSGTEDDAKGRLGLGWREIAAGWKDHEKGDGK